MHLSSSCSALDICCREDTEPPDSCSNPSWPSSCKESIIRDARINGLTYPNQLMLHVTYGLSLKGQASVRFSPHMLQYPGTTTNGKCIC